MFYKNSEAHLPVAGNFWTILGMKSIICATFIICHMDLREIERKLDAIICTREVTVEVCFITEPTASNDYFRPADIWGGITRTTGSNSS